MSILHTVNKSPFERNALSACLRVAKEDGAILLIEDGVYAALKGTEHTKAVQDALKKVHVYALWPDVEARGMQDRVIEGIKQIDYAGFVELAAQHNSIQSWL